ncbi:hypothetical protein D9753_25090 [Streptomyces dangxiongensis]|uniref:Uncharacterized protein n=1 Tax=Streptomyces dangxiongensis TaxID=1442032 RepID=A0A3G2JGV4_9ACTN|nr:hypothetical protein [Streptomyces dangxiongensis]AYN41610.1 hypothetical protein D9753_25090 [Streptomyces dangxiongensis]
MRNRSTWRRFGTAAVAGAAAVAVLAPAASAADSAPPAWQTLHAVGSTQLPAQLTVASYQAWLKNAHTPEAAKTLKAFTVLPNLKKYLFVQHLQNRSTYKALQTQLKGGPRGLHTVVPYNKFVSFAHDVRVAKTGGRKPATTVTFSVTERIFNVPVTAETVWVTYQTTKGKHLTVTGGGAKVVNTNAAIAIQARNTSTGQTGGSALTSTQWHATPRVTSFGKAVDQQQTIAADGYWKAQLITTSS